MKKKHVEDGELLEWGLAFYFFFLLFLRFFFVVYLCLCWGGETSWLGGSQNGSKLEWVGGEALLFVFGGQNGMEWVKTGWLVVKLGMKYCSMAQLYYLYFVYKENTTDDLSQDISSAFIPWFMLVCAFLILH